ncbi:MAG: methyltransferase domain-containing protein [Robiginitomaculum sp.]
MANDQIQPEIFDRALIAARRAAMGNDLFLLERCARDAAERLLDINRNFKAALIIGNSAFTDALLAGLPDGKIKSLTRADHTSRPPNGVIAIDEEALPFAPESFDLIVNGLTLHQINDLPGALLQIKAALRPDGLFIGAMFGGATLTELRQTLYMAEEQIYGRVTPRVSPMADFSQAAALLQRAGFALPVVDSDRFTVHYKDPMRLLSDLKAMGETNALTKRSRMPVSKRFLTALRAAYLEHYANDDGKARASFEILWLTGWSPHESQQKPLKPGSAKMRLADALGAVETKV